MTRGEQAVNVAEVARTLNLHPQTVYTYAQRGRIPGFRVGRAWRFYLSEVQASLSSASDVWALPKGGR